MRSLLIALTLFIIGCKNPSTIPAVPPGKKVEVIDVPNTSANVYVIEYDGLKYLVVSSNTNGAVAITVHRP